MASIDKALQKEALNSSTCTDLNSAPVLRSVKGYFKGIQWYLDSEYHLFYVDEFFPTKVKLLSSMTSTTNNY